MTAQTMPHGRNPHFPQWPERPLRETAPRNGKQCASYRKGVAAEGYARQLLESKSYKILAQRYRSKVGEIDLIAQRGDHLAFVEVKGRKTQEEAAWAVLPRQQARIASAAEAFLAEHQQFSQCTASFDVVLVTPSEGCAHIEHAFLA